MPRNIAAFERVARVVVGLLLLALVFVGPRTAWGYLGLIPLLTGLVGYCPLYHALGISTNRARTGSGASRSV
jgi:hypothetical protein